MPPHLLPDPSHLRLEYLRADTNLITVILSATGSETRCPLCNNPARRIHSRYSRTLADLPWNGVAVRLRLTVRRFFCQISECQRRIFTERLPDLVAPSARRTLRLTEAMELIGFAIGGEAGARVLAGLSITTSPDTVLRLIRAAELDSRETPRVLGVDDWAFRRGHRYGTILVDLERHCVVDLLPDRKPDTLVAWFEQHGSPEIISRDRGGSYAEAAQRGAPDAVQVADRFHVSKNLAERLELFFLRHRSALKEAAAAAAEERAPPESEEPLPEEMYQGKRKTSQDGQQRAEEVSLTRHAPHVERYKQVHALREKGVSIAAIARQIGVSRKTVYVYLRMDQPPERKRPTRNPKDQVLAPYKPYLLKRWEEGCHNGLALWREIQERGYSYSRATVSRFVAQLRRDPKASHAIVAKRSGVMSAQGPSARLAALLCLQRLERLDEEEMAYLKHLRAQDETIETVCRLGQDFATMLRERTGERLDSWIEQAKGSGIREMERFAVGLLADEAAVRAGLTLVWSNGAVEGQVNRLKLVKRAMYGRANFDLLRQRVLRAA
jgi:transposase